ncbi:MAG: tryptophan--tRNA ligase [Firmicutes bacterium]|nr:tryptophan--tRNA ligase [Bacillota bacterium]
MTGKGRILSGMRPTGRLHLGHYSVIENWARLSEDYDAYFFTADWHAITTQFDQTDKLRENKRQVVIDYISAGLDPEKCHIFHQSDIKEHAELHLLMSMITPLPWLERVPTYKGQVRQFKDQGKDIATYGFLGYPLLMSADILMYRPVGVPVGEDQLPHCEFTRELARRFNNMYNVEIFPEPEAILAKIKVLPGTDNRKMSKSYNNYINLSFTAEEVKDKVWQMITDPARIRKTDPGHPDICAVYAYHGFYNQEEQPEICAACQAGSIGCGQCKKMLTQKINDFLDPIREKRAQLETMPDLLDDIIEDGNNAARQQAQITMEMVREAIGI